MKMNEKKEGLIKKLHNVNYDVHEKLFEGEATADFVGFDDMHFAKALRYVPNNVLKKWIKNCKDELKEVVNENTN